MFCRTHCLSDLFAIDRTIISLFDVKSQFSLPRQNRASQSMAIFSDTVILTALKDPPVCCKILHYISYISRVIANFLLIFLNFSYDGNNWVGLGQISMTLLNCMTSKPPCRKQDSSDMTMGWVDPWLGWVGLGWIEFGQI